MSIKIQGNLVIDDSKNITANTLAISSTNWDALSVTGGIFGGSLGLNGPISAIDITASSMNVQNTTASTSRTTGALKVAGGIGVTGNIYAGQIYGISTSGNYNRRVVTDADYQYINDVVLDPSSGGNRAFIDMQFLPNANNPNQIITVGPSGNKANIYFGVSNTFVTPGTMNVSNTTASTSNTTGALIVAGGVGVSGNVYANKVYSTSDLGVGEVLTTSTLSSKVSDGVQTTQGFGTNGFSTIIKGDNLGRITTNVYTSGIFTGGFNINFANTFVTPGTMNVSNTTASTSNTTGALIVAGGLGVSGNVYASAIRGAEIVTRYYSTSNTSSLTINIDQNDFFDVFALATPLTINIPTGTALFGRKIIIKIKDNGTPQTLTWNVASGGFRTIGTTLPTTTTANKITYVGAIWNAIDNYWDVIAATTQA